MKGIDLAFKRQYLWISREISKWKGGGGFGPSKGVLDFVAFIELPTKATPREEWETLI